MKEKIYNKKYYIYILYFITSTHNQLKYLKIIFNIYVCFPLRHGVRLMTVGN